MKKISLVLAAALSAALFSAPASAQLIRAPGDLVVSAQSPAPDPSLTEAQFRRNGGGYRGGFRGRGYGRGYGGRGYGGRGYGGRGYGYRRGVGAGIAGLAAGALIGGVIASQAGRAEGNSVGYCESRFQILRSRKRNLSGI